MDSKSAEISNGVQSTDFEGQGHTGFGPNGDSTPPNDVTDSVNGHHQDMLTSLKNELRQKSTESDEAFLRDLFGLLMEKVVREQMQGECKVVEFVQPATLFETLDLDIPELPQTNEKLLEICRETIKYSVKTGHPRFFNQLFSGLDLFTLGGSWLTEALNTSQYTFEVAPVFTVMEEVMLRKLRSIVGYSDGDGIFCPGGSISNLYALNLARFRRFPQVKVSGMQGLPPLCVFTSEHGHYSMKKTVALLGLGLNALRVVAVDDRGRMCATALERGIQEALGQGIQPIFVNATAGTTVVGAYDPLVAIAEVCERYGAWMHVDACWGGGALFSKTHRHLLEGIERSDSVAWNPHKMMGAPLQCCTFLTRHKDLLQPCHSASAEYLFQQDKFYDVSFDTGDKSVQCGRKVDVFKLWLLWKAHGSVGLERRIDHVFHMAKHLRQRLVETEGFRLVFDEPECTNVCFWYIPPNSRGQDETSDWWTRLGTVAPLIKERMVRAGSMLIGYNPLGSRVNFFRMVISNHAVTTQDMDFVVEEIARLGCDL